MAEPFDTIDAKIEQYKPLIAVRQNEFFLNGNGRFLQLKRTHKNVPDGTPTTPDNLDDLPPGETEGWGTITLPGKLEIALEVHKYKGPSGHGWILIIYLTVAGVVWRRVIDFGNGGFDQPWTEAVDDAP